MHIPLQACIQRRCCHASVLPSPSGEVNAGSSAVALACICCASGACLAARGATASLPSVGTADASAAPAAALLAAAPSSSASPNMMWPRPSGPDISAAASCPALPPPAVAAACCCAACGPPAAAAAPSPAAPLPAAGAAAAAALPSPSVGERGVPLPPGWGCPGSEAMRRGRREAGRRASSWALSRYRVISCGGPAELASFTAAQPAAHGRGWGRRTEGEPLPPAPWASPPSQLQAIALRG